MGEPSQRTLAEVTEELEQVRGELARLRVCRAHLSMGADAPQVNGYDPTILADALEQAELARNAALSSRDQSRRTLVLVQRAVAQYDAARRTMTAHEVARLDAMDAESRTAAIEAASQQWHAVQEDSRRWNEVATNALEEVSNLQRKLREAEDLLAGRTTPPTKAEMVAHESTGGLWRWVSLMDGKVIFGCSEDGARWVYEDPMESLPLRRGAVYETRYWALNAKRELCAWPRVSP